MKLPAERNIPIRKRTFLVKRLCRAADAQQRGDHGIHGDLLKSLDLHLIYSPLQAKRPELAELSGKGSGEGINVGFAEGLRKIIMRVLITHSQRGPLRHAMLNFAVERVAFHADQSRGLSPDAKPVASQGQGGVRRQEKIHVHRRLKILHTVIEQQGGWSYNGIRHGGKIARKSNALRDDAGGLTQIEDQAPRFLVSVPQRQRVDRSRRRKFSGCNAGRPRGSQVPGVRDGNCGRHKLPERLRLRTIRPPLPVDHCHLPSRARGRCHRFR